MSSQVIRLKGLNRGFSQDTWGRDILYLCVVPSELTERKQFLQLSLSEIIYLAESHYIAILVRSFFIFLLETTIRDLIRVFSLQFSNQ